MSHARQNHYVPKWYQKRFCIDKDNHLHRLELSLLHSTPSDTKCCTRNSVSERPTSQIFYERDLYSTILDDVPSDEFERIFFGKIDNIGARCVKAFVEKNSAYWAENFCALLDYIDVQNIRTPKGLLWLKTHYPKLTQSELMKEMKRVRRLHRTLWAEGVREIVSAKESSVKFIVSDHPVTVFNNAHLSTSEKCKYTSDPSIRKLGTQTLFALDKNHLLILTHYDYASDPENCNPNENRINSSNLNRNSLIRADILIHNRILREEDVLAINVVLKSRAKKYIAAGREDLLFPENQISIKWDQIRGLLLPPKDQLLDFGCEIIVGFKDGDTYYQDEYGRNVPKNPYLEKNPIDPSKLREIDPCGCGSGRLYKSCRQNKKANQRPSWREQSIRERNLDLIAVVKNILGLMKGKTWDDVRREFNEEHVKRIHEVYMAIWPPYTDILSLLPKPDDELRALYSGIVHPELIPTYVTSLAPYFDQLLVQSPFVNPTSVRSELNPMHTPHTHLFDTFKNIHILLTLEPFIEAGFVNLFPGPCDFNNHLKHEMLNIAGARCPCIKIDKKEEKLQNTLLNHDLKRTILALSQPLQRSLVKKIRPMISDENLERILKYIAAEKSNDPLTLLSENLFYEKEEQVLIFRNAPNFELSMYIAQATGSIIVTTSQFRWKELQRARVCVSDLEEISLKLFRDTLSSPDYLLTSEPSASFQYRQNGAFASYRIALNEILLTTTCISNSVARKLVSNLATKLEKATLNVASSGEHYFKARFKCLLPRSGLVDNNVQRLLLTTSDKYYAEKVTMALFVDPQDLNIALQDQ